jgi:energy-coupling factor transporter ATP-binding protein EcfA2
MKDFPPTDRTNLHAIALHGVSFSVDAGEFVSIIGASACGKPKLLRLIAGLDFQPLVSSGWEPRRLKRASEFFGVAVGFCCLSLHQSLISPHIEEESFFTMSSLRF